MLLGNAVAHVSYRKKYDYHHHLTIMQIECTDCTMHDKIKTIYFFNQNKAGTFNALLPWHPVRQCPLLCNCFKLNLSCTYRYLDYMKTMVGDCQTPECSKSPKHKMEAVHNKDKMGVNHFLVVYYVKCQSSSLTETPTTTPHPSCWLGLLIDDTDCCNGCWRCRTQYPTPSNYPEQLHYRGQAGLEHKGATVYSSHILICKDSP